MKAPSLDGLHGVFYKHFCLMLGEELTDEVLEAVDTKIMPKGWNDTLIMLIPKVETPKRISLFAYQSLQCGVIGDLKKFGKSFKSFTSRNYWTSPKSFYACPANYGQANESIHIIKKKRGKKGLCVVKPNMHTTYDDIE